MSKRFLRDSISLFIISAVFIQHLHAAQCEYSVVNDWGAGFQGEIRITNNDAVSINSWSVSWEYIDGSSIDNSWSSVLTGQNPYSAAPLSWNATILPGTSIAFGFTGMNGASGVAETPTVMGSVCGSVASSSSNSSSVSSSLSSAASTSSMPASSSSSLASSSVSSISSSSSSSSVSNMDLWRLDAAESRLNFSTTKKIHIVENMTFKRLSGAVSQNGVATLVVELASIDSGIGIRDERMQNLLFETASFPLATVTVPIDMATINAIAVGQSSISTITADLSLHGITNTITTDLKVSRLSNNRIIVQNVAPLLIVADNYNLERGVEELKIVANLDSIGKVVPVDFMLFYDAL